MVVGERAFDPEVDQLRNLLRLRPGQLEYPIVNAAQGHFEALNSPTGIDEMRVTTRSLGEMMFYLAHGVTVPDEHYCRGLT